MSTISPMRLSSGSDRRHPLQPEPNRVIQAVLFDLDGTLADTAPDLGYALNQTLLEAGRRPLPPEPIRAAASHGSGPLIDLGFSDCSSTEQEERRQRLLYHYSNNLTRHTTLMNGIDTLLQELEQRRLPWGVVTNKPARFTEPLMKQLALQTRSHCIISGDTTPHAKPHPQPLLFAAEQLQLPPHHCLYVGDAARDIEAGRRASMTTLACRFGYLAPDDVIENWGADGIIDHPQEVWQWI